MKQPEYGSGPPTRRLSRATLRDALQQALQAEPAVLALWEGGSAAYQRVDAWSDLDLVAIAENDAVERVFDIAHAALTALGPIDLRWRIPEPAWHGQSQTFWKLADTAPGLFVDLAVQTRSTENRLLERERHGTPVVLFDREDLVHAPDFDRAAWSTITNSRVEQLSIRARLFDVLVTKEVARGNRLGAAAAYQGFVLNPLHEALRLRHCPDRYEYGMRYASTDLPPDVVSRLEHFAFVQDLEDLESKRILGQKWLLELLEDLRAHSPG